MAAQHTPGPWAVTSSTDDVHSQARNGQNWICQGPNPGAPSSPPDRERVANARLIADLPVILSALIEVVDAFQGSDVGPHRREALDVAAAVIAKVSSNEVAVPPAVRCGCNAPATTQYDGDDMCAACASYCAKRDWEEADMPGGL